MSLLRMLMDEGKDIWSYKEEGFFESVKAGDRRRGHWKPHEIRRSDNAEGSPFRESHELAHLVCCRDENIMNPWWDFNRFIDTDNHFTFEEGKLEGEVLMVDILLTIYDQDRFRYLRGAGEMEFVVKDTMNVLYPWYGPLVENTVYLNDLHMRWYYDSIRHKWTLARILDEALRKYKLIRSARLTAQ